METDVETRIELENKYSLVGGAAATEVDTQLATKSFPWGERIGAFAMSVRSYSERGMLRLRVATAKSHVRAQAMEWYRKNTPREFCMAAGLALALVVFSVMGVRALEGMRTPTEQQVVAKWLDAQLAGGTGSEFAATGPDGVRIYFHAIRNWRIVSHPKPGEFVVEVGSAIPSGGISSGECRVVVANASDPSSKDSSLKVVRVDFNTTSASGT